MDETGLYLAVAIAYGLLGAALSVSYHLCPRLREEPTYHVFTLSLTFLAAVLAICGTRLDSYRSPVFHFGAQFFLFLAASLCYVPALVFLLLHYSEHLLERILSPGSRREPPHHPLTPEEQWKRIQSYLETLAADPTDAVVREKLGDLYAEMGFFDSAVYEYQKAAAWLEKGYAHGHVLYKAARVLVEKKRTIHAAVIPLRRIVRLYPKSYFAGYARRILNHFEAHSGVTADDTSFLE